MNKRYRETGIPTGDTELARDFQSRCVVSFEIVEASTFLDSLKGNLEGQRPINQSHPSNITCNENPVPVDQTEWIDFRRTGRMSPPAPRNSGVGTWKVPCVNHREGIFSIVHDNVNVPGEGEDGTITEGLGNPPLYEQVSTEHLVLVLFPDVGPQGPRVPPFPHPVKVPLRMEGNGRKIARLVANPLKHSEMFEGLNVTPQATSPLVTIGSPLRQVAS